MNSTALLISTLSRATTLGLPASGVMTLMLGALTIRGIQPGPEVMTMRPDLFWGLIASMWIGNLMLVVLNLPMIGLWVKLLQVANATSRRY